MVGAETHAVFAQAGARRLVEALHVLRDPLTFQHAERLDELKRDAARHAGHILGGSELEQRRQDFLDVGLEPEIKPRLHGVARRTGEVLVGDDAHARFQDLFGGDKLADRLAQPPDRAV